MKNAGRMAAAVVALSVSSLVWAPRALAQPLEKVLLNGATAPSSSGAVVVDYWTDKSVQVSVGSPCTSYTLVVEGRNAGTAWAQIGNALTEADVGAGASKLYDLNTTARELQARVTAISNCTVSVYLHGGPHR